MARVARGTRVARVGGAGMPSDHRTRDVRTRWPDEPASLPRPVLHDHGRPAGDFGFQAHEQPCCASSSFDGKRWKDIAITMGMNTIVL